MLPLVVEDYLRRLKDTLETDTDTARALIGKLVGTVPLKRSGDRLIGEVRGNLSGLLDLAVANDGSGGPICSNSTPCAYRDNGGLTSA